MEKKYAIGLDFGTLSGRAVLVELDSGEELAQSVLEYPHGVMDRALPDGTALEADFALQHPQDYLEVLRRAIPDVLKQAGADPKNVVGIGVDFTACTILPVTEDGTPLCFLEEYKNRPHAYVKLWKHHAAQEEASLLNRTAEKRGEKWLARYGGKISSEWMFPKVWQILREDEEIYRSAVRFVEATDWIVWQLTGRETHCSCTAGYKAMYHKREGYPDKSFFAALDPRLEQVVGTKISEDILPIGSRAGAVTAEMAEQTGLACGTVVAVGNVDAHVALPAVGITEPGKLLMILGTSTCHILMGERERLVPGMCGVVEDGVVEGCFGYEAGQSCVGDHFDWFVKNCVPASYQEQAAREGVSLHRFLREKAARQRPGESGLLALDWWNGNRSVLVDADLTGLLLGMTLQTRPEEIYRALIEATAYGTRMIIETFEENGVPVRELYAAGGIAEKDTLMMQIYADVCGREIRLSGSAQAPARGSAMFGAVAAGYFSSIQEAAKVMARVKPDSYRPNAENSRIYEGLYQEYKALHDYFGRGDNDVMKRLKRLKRGGASC